MRYYIVEKYRVKKKNLYMTFIDLKKAYESVERDSNVRVNKK